MGRVVRYNFRSNQINVNQYSNCPTLRASPHGPAGRVVPLLYAKRLAHSLRGKHHSSYRGTFENCAGELLALVSVAEFSS
jgi:hypothetical protein